MGNKKYQEYVDSFQAIYVRPSVNVSLQAGHVIIWIKQKTQAYMYITQCLTDDCSEIDTA